MKGARLITECRDGATRSHPSVDGLDHMRDVDSGQKGPASSAVCRRPVSQRRKVLIAKLAKASLADFGPACKPESMRKAMALELLA